jgi:2-polyprenyl-3-methyl-5-hydroxy-6-metoxy-1,4-benzoquinol methylase
MEEYYSTKATYEKVSRDRRHAVLGLLPKKHPRTVLEVGCGGGSLGAAIKELGEAKVYGTDISPAAVEEAKKHVDGAWTMDLEHPELWPKEISEKRFDVIILSEVLEHLFYPEKVLRNLAPLLAEGGRLVITVPNILFWKNRLRILSGHFEYEETGLMDRGHIHFFSWKSLQECLGEAGYRIIETKHHVPTRILKPLRNMFPGLVSYQFALSAMPK